MIRNVCFAIDSNPYWGGHWDFWFCGFGYFLDRFFRFCAKKLSFFGFGVYCGLQIFRFLVFGFQFSPKIPTHFRIWYLMWFSVFNSYLTYLGSGFSSIWAAITGLHWSWIAARCKCYQEECMTNQLKYHSDPYVTYV